MLYKRTFLIVFARFWSLAPSGWSANIELKIATRGDPMKEIYTEQIVELLAQCDDLSLLDLIVKLLNKSV